MIKILIGGDLCPRGEVLPCFERGDAAGIFHDLLDDFQTADLSIVNLECPLTDVDSPIPKIGPALRAPSLCIAGLKNAGIRVLNLANNHILDHGAQGVENTLRLAESAGMATVGAGRNLAEARQILIRDVAGKRTGILAVAEHEFSTATNTSAGANPLDVINIVRDISAHRTEWDFLIVLLHGGNEGYPYPSPRLMDTCRFLVEQGAGAVICQHSHCVGCFEEYRGGHIVYGQGNLVFDFPWPLPGWHDGVLVRICFEDGRSRMELVPYEQSCGGPGAKRPSAERAEALLRAVEDRSKHIQDATFVQDRWIEFCRNQRFHYLESILGHGRILSRLDRYGHVIRWLYSREALRQVENTLCCEAHREALETIFKHRLFRN
jgi:hypothetical protein